MLSTGTLQIKEIAYQYTDLQVSVLHRWQDIIFRVPADHVFIELNAYNSLDFFRNSLSHYIINT